MFGIAPHHPLQGLEPIAVPGHAAPGAMNKGYNTVNIGKLGQLFGAKCIGDAPCRHLVILTPGGFEGFFAEMAAGQCRIPEDMPAIEKSAKQHNMAFTGPPLD
jgi:hypothetical protein